MTLNQYKQIKDAIKETKLDNEASYFDSFAEITSEDGERYYDDEDAFEAQEDGEVVSVESLSIWFKSETEEADSIAEDACDSVVSKLEAIGVKLESKSKGWRTRGGDGDEVVNEIQIIVE